ncbi:probable glucomannan 4-beta-mannosyltransferase 9 isoform X2 [Hordeum vulgare subsp. vulgare]|uniref:probable glucomannan 4-beta-mannosyltransferase 9 isoform X2 n=1 Tax=Hordeum vulgare subsp. vulgare TaxID=112509 RepID=UPI001D1A3C55|nr:probable glucomannan 4-beta-mannosyltransferase 9 isoform X2 [Hordeum vulgare subsp. vulgare]
MSAMLFAEKVYMAVVVLAVRLLGRRPERQYRSEPVGDDDPELGSAAYPMVLVQIPMYNEREVYQLSIGAACGLSWPSDRIVVQVLDDSTDPVIKELVQVECRRWVRKGVNIKYEIRDNRRGYKAGALKEGMKHGYVKDCDLVAVFDADFQPEPDFLQRAVPFLIHNPDIALVQARWKFVNADECLMTRMQEMSLDYHFKVEQEVGSSTYAFFGFNGTAGVWRISALNEAGGWKDRTTVEDMDLAVRASLKGWKFVYLGDLKVKNELPSTFKAFRYQQHRWSCGPANLFRKMVMEIARNKKVTLWKKIHVIYNFFLVRKVVAHIVTFVFYCLVIPTTVLVPEVEVPKWGCVYIPTIITLLNAVGTPRCQLSKHLCNLFKKIIKCCRSVHLVIFWVLFENVMSLHRAKATFIGLLEAGTANEWVVTEKLGDTLKTKMPSKALKKLRVRIGERLHLWELGVAAYLFLCGCYDISFGNNHYFIFLFMQSITFFIVGVGYVGTFVAQ